MRINWPSRLQARYVGLPSGRSFCETRTSTVQSPLLSPSVVAIFCVTSQHLILTITPIITVGRSVQVQINEI